MNGDTPKKPAEGDWQADKHDAPAVQTEPQKSQAESEVVVANLRDDVSHDQGKPDPAQSSANALETEAKQDSLVTAETVMPPTPESTLEPQSQLEAQAQDQLPPEEPVTQPVATSSPGWTTSMNGDSAWDLADSEMEAHENQIAEPATPSIQWTASEFMVHEKSPLWYAALMAIGAVLALFSQLVIHDLITTIAIILITVLFIFVATHKPRTLPYRVDDTGVTIGNKIYSYSQFKSFGIVQEGAFSNITLVPLKRFGQPLSIYYPPEEEDKIVQVLSAYMPVSQVKLDFIDRLLKSVHL